MDELLLCQLTNRQELLRELHKIDVLVTMSEFSRTYGFKLYYIEGGKTICENHCFEKYETYIQALEKGIIAGKEKIK